jgi:hypothetical protein
MKARDYAKFIAAAVGAAAASVGTAAVGATWQQITVTAITSGVGAVAVLIVRNGPKPPATG